MLALHIVNISNINMRYIKADRQMSNRLLNKSALIIISKAPIQIDWSAPYSNTAQILGTGLIDY
jgi:hypothetical protein